MTADQKGARLVLPAVFDEKQGWAFSAEEVPLSWGKAPDENPFVVVTVDGREIVCAEKTAWADGEAGGPTPHRLVAFLAFSGIAVSDTKVLLQENLGTHGLPAWGIDDDGDLTLSASVPVGPSIPLDAARRQLLVCLGLIAETVDKILDAVNAESDGERPGTPPGSITKRFLRAL
jgi:hypothetical protein